MEDERLKEVIRKAVREEMSPGNGRYIDVSRIPLICQSIVGIHTDIQDIKDTIRNGLVTHDQFWSVRTIVYGTVGVLLLAVLTAILVLVFPHLSGQIG